MNRLRECDPGRIYMSEMRGPFSAVLADIHYRFFLIITILYPSLR